MNLNRKEEKDTIKQSIPTVKPRKWSVRAVAIFLIFVMIASDISYNLYQRHALALAMQEIANAKEPKEVSQESMKQIAKSLKMSEDDLKQYQTAMAYMEDGKYKEAIEPLRPLYDRHKENEKVGISISQTMAQLYYLTEDYKNCNAVCDELLAKEDGDSKGVFSFMNGISLLNLNKYKKSEKYLEKAIEAGYDKVSCGMQLMYVKYILKKYSEVASLGKTILKETLPEDSKTRVQYLVAISLTQSGKYEDSIKYWNKVITDDATSDYYFYRGISYAGLGEYESARVDFEQVIELDDNKELTKSAKSLLKQIKASQA